MTDCEFLLDVLGDGEEHTLTEILRRSFEERGCGLTVHSRAADLRKRGHLVEHHSVPGEERGMASVYRLLDAPTPPVDVHRRAAAAGVGASSEPAPAFPSVGSLQLTIMDAA